MSAVTILANASQARSGQSDALDVSAFSTLRLNLQLTGDHGRHPHIRTFIETAAAAAGPWRVIDERRWSRVLPGTERITLAGFDSFVRLRWAGGCEGEGITKSYGAPYGPGGGTLIGESGAINPQFIIGLTGDGKPDAA
jgi:hypothetical protein